MVRRFLLTAVALALVAGASAAPAVADNSAQKVNFLDHPLTFCTGASGGAPTDSFAVIKRDGDGKVSAEVSLKRRLPNTTYQLDLIPIGCGLLDIAFVTTNAQGNANVHLSGQGPASGAWVTAVSTPFPSADVLATPGVVFGT